MDNRMHRQGLDGCLRKHLAFLTSESGSPKNGVLYHTKIVEMWRMLASGLVLPSKLAGKSMMANRMHRQGLDGRPRKNLASLTSESGSPKKWCAI